MKIVVCVKQVPDRNSRFEIDRERNHIRYDGLKFETNDFDRYAVEEALRLRDKAGGEITVLTVGPDRAKEVVNKALAMGADRAIHVMDDRIAGSDAHAVALIMARVLKDRGVDLVLAGVQSEDQGYSQTGILLAEMLGWPHVAVVVKAEPQGTKIRVKREVEGGALVPVTVNLPAVLAIQTGINEPRYPTLPGIMKAKSKPREVFDLAKLGIDPKTVGAAGRWTEVLGLAFPEARGRAQIIPGGPKEAAAELIRLLREKEKVIK